MSVREGVGEGEVSWLDLWTSDVAGSRQFYCSLFDWEAQAPSEEFGGYWMFTRAGVPIAGGMGDMGDAAADDTWKIYLTTLDLAASVALATQRGATVLSPPTPVADMGRQAVLCDPTGATFGLWEPGTFQGFSVLAEHGAPCWFELRTRNYEEAVAFYRDVCHLAATVMSDDGAMRYTTLSARGHDVMGVLDAATRLGDASSKWVVYWQVDDVDLALSRVTQLGGTVRHAASDSPYGRVATVADPAGAEFHLLSV